MVNRHVGIKTVKVNSLSDKKVENKDLDRLVD